MSIVSSPCRVVILTGPTASGKTELLDRAFGRGALSVSGPSNALRSLKAEVVSADSMQAYRGMDIGTAKPDAEARARLPHHLIDILDPDRQYTAGDFVRLADAACESIAARGAVPFVSGGTGFYLRNFLCGPPRAPQADAELRARVARDLEAYGPEVLRAELAAADPAIAARIAPRDTYRLTRAVEILRATGRAPSEFAPKSSPRANFHFLVIGIDRPREELAARIDARVDAMFRSGLRGEVEGLIRAGYGPDSPGLKAIGYAEFLAAPEASDAEVAQLIKLHTRQYAKRQMTFLRALPGIRWLEPDADILASAITGFLSE